MSPQSRISHARILIFTLVLLLMGVGEAGAQVQIFKAPQAFLAGPNPVAEATGDFNGDGKMDLVVANNSNNTVSVMLGNGDGTFGAQEPANFPVGGPPAAIAVGDFNGDGKLDLAVLNGGVGILLGNGDGTFQPVVNYTANGAGSWITVGDFNGDGKLDIAVNNSLTMSVLIGNGNGTFQLAVDYQTGYAHSHNLDFYDLRSSWIGNGDFNDNGKPSLLLAATFVAVHCTRIFPIPHCQRTAYNNYLELFVGNGDGTFQSQNFGLNGMGNGCCSLGATLMSALEVADFNHDGKLDVAASSNSGAAIFLGNGDGTFQAPATYAAGSQPGPLAVGDLNGDGKLDLAVTNGAGGVSVLLGNGDGTFQTAVNYAAGPSLSAIAILDAGGKAYIAGANNIVNGTVTVLTGNGDGTFVEAPARPLGGGTQPLSLAAGDFNGDGKLDFVVADSSGVNSGSPGCSVVLGNGDGTFQPADFIPVTQGNPAGVAIADLNGDGKLDLAVANGGTGALVLLGNGDGTFQPPASYSTPDIGSYPSVALADLNGDNKLDLAVTDGNGHVDILLGNGDGTFQGAVSYPTGQACDPNSVAICMEVPAVGDFNGDGKLDLAVPDVTANTVSVLLGNGDGTFQPPVSYPVATQPTAVVVSDFRGSGKIDLAVANNGSGWVSVLLGNGDGTFHAAANYPIGVGPAGPGAILVGDFNGDGRVDIAAQGSGVVSVLLGNGDGTFQTQVNYAFGDAQFASGIAAGDFNGDYTTDLVVGGGLGTFGDTTASVLFNTAGFYLYLTESGTGGGTVASAPAGIDCSATCSASFAGAANVTLTATPNSASNFTGWNGACSGTGACSVTMKAATSVTATFTLQDFSLSPASARLTLQHGAQGTDVMTLAGLNGPFTIAIQLTCAVTGPAPLPTCALSASSVTPGANSVTSTLTITALASAAAIPTPLSHRQSKLLYALWLPFIFGITLVGGSRKLRSKHWPLCGFLVLLLFLQVACGGGTGSNGGGGSQGETNYTVTITGTSGAIQHATQVAVTVQ